MASALTCCTDCEPVRYTMVTIVLCRVCKAVYFLQLLHGAPDVVEELCTDTYFHDVTSEFAINKAFTRQQGTCQGRI